MFPDTYILDPGRGCLDCTIFFLTFAGKVSSLSTVLEEELSIGGTHSSAGGGDNGSSYNSVLHGKYNYELDFSIVSLTG